MYESIKSSVKQHNDNCIYLERELHPKKIVLCINRNLFTIGFPIQYLQLGPEILAPLINIHE